MDLLRRAGVAVVASVRPREGRASRLAVAAVVVVIALYGGLSTSLRLWLVRNDRAIGLSDPAAYAEQGRSLAEGRGFRVQYISSFYLPYDRSIDRPDDHWPPLMGMMIAPFFATLGVSAFHAKIPAALMGGVGLPLAAAWLGIAVSRRAWVGLVAGFLMLINREVFAESLVVLVNVTLAALLTGFCAAMIGARTRPFLFVVAGVLGALAYYSKFSEVLLVGLFPAVALLVSGPRVLRQRWLYAGWAVLVAGIVPWQVSNLRHYGSPIHAIHNYASGFIGLTTWEETHYRAYWGRDLPKTSDRWTKYADRYWTLTSQQREEFVRLVVLGSGTGQADWYKLGPLGVAAYAFLRGDGLLPSLKHRRPDGSIHKSLERPVDPEASRRAAAGWRAYWARSWGELRTALERGGRSTLRFLVAGHRSTLLPNLLGTAYAVCVLVGVPLRDLARGRLRRWPSEWPRAWGIVAALVFLGLVHGTLLVYFYSVSGAFSFPALPVMAVLGLTGVAAATSRVVRPLHRLLQRRWPVWAAVRRAFAAVAIPAVCVGLVAFAATRALELQSWQQSSVGMRPRTKAAGVERFTQWAASHLPPNAVIMARHPWQLRFYSPPGVKTVATPWSEDPRETLGIAYYYGVTHILRDPSRPYLNAYLAKGPPGITRVAGAPAELYAIDWSAVPAGDVLLPHTDRDAREASQLATR